MENIAKKYILNLIRDLDQSFVDYFDQKEFELIVRSDVQEMASLDYILVTSSEEAVKASKDFATDKNDIAIVCIGKSDDIQKFLIHEGRFSISHKILELEVGEVLLNNFFHKEKSLHLEENFGSLFNKVEEFSITNHINAGQSFDQACYRALKSGFNLLSLRTFLDHSLLFLGYLKQSGEAEYPFIYEYSTSKEVFGVNIQLNIEDFFAEYLFESFGSLGTEAPQKYLMSILAQTCDYLDVCYLSKSNKLVISALWDKSGTKSLQGIGFHHIETAKKQIRKRDVQNQNEYDLSISFSAHKELDASDAAQLPGNLIDVNINLDKDSKISSNFDAVLGQVVENFKESFPDREISKITENEIDDLLPEELQGLLTENDKKSLLENVRISDVRSLMSDKLEVVKEKFRDDLDFQDELINTSADTLAEEVSQKVKGNSLNEFLESTLVKGKKEESEAKVVVGGGDGLAEDERIEIKGGKPAADDFKQVIKGLAESDVSDFVKSFASTLDEKEAMQVISGDDKNINAMTTRWVVKSLSSSKALDNSPASVRAFLRDTAPKRLEKELKSFAASLGRDVSEMTSDEIINFKTTRLPELIGDMIRGEDSIEDFAQKITDVSSKEREGAFDFDKMSEKDPELNDFANELKENLVQKIKTLGADVPHDELQQALKQTIKEKIANILEDPSLDKQQKEEKKAVLVEQMSQTLGISKNDVQAMISIGTAKSNKAVDELVRQKAVASEKNSGQQKLSAIDAQMSLKLKQIEAENQKLKESLKALKLQTEAKNEVQAKVKGLKGEIAAKDLDENYQEKNELVEEKNQLLAKLESIESLSKEDKDKITHLVNQGDAKQSVAKKQVRKLELEADSREVVFSQELERAQKALKAKDYVVQKAKEAMRNTISKKDQELKSMQAQIHSISQRIESNESEAMEREYRRLKSEHENLSKTSELYKNKIETLTKKLEESRTDSNAAQIAEENRTLKRMKISLENQANASIRQNKKVEERLQKATSSELKLKIENRTLTSDLKATQLQLRKVKEQSEVAVSSVKNAVSSQNDQLVKDFDQVQAKNLSLNESLKLAESKIKDLVTASKVAKINEVDEDAIVQKYTTEMKRINSELELSKAQSKALQVKIDELSKAANSAEKEQSSVGKSGGDPVKQRLERSVKKLNAEMVKAQTEANEHKKSAFKANKEIVGLKNQLALLKRELDKVKKQASGKAKKAA